MQQNEQKVLRISDSSLNRIRIQDIMNNDGWLHPAARLELRPTETGIVLLRDHRPVARWDLWEQYAGQLPPILNDEGSFKCNRSPAIVFYVYGNNDRKRYRHLYYYRLTDVVGTRNELALRYPIHCLSHNQRKHDPALRIKRMMLLKKGERRDRRMLKRLKARLGIT